MPKTLHAIVEHRENVVGAEWIALCVWDFGADYAASGAIAGAAAEMGKREVCQGWPDDVGAQARVVLAVGPRPEDLQWCEPEALLYTSRVNSQHAFRTFARWVSRLEGDFRILWFRLQLDAKRSLRAI